uniref:Uncharacterized protein n=1 Tax=Arion vulgaris TaxID=1028688 RepID=A0A0B6YAM9_9EUPU
MSSSKSSHYNYFKEKVVLQEEEKVLKEMLAKFQDQLNRLKIEELALMSLLKMQEEQSKTSGKIRQEENSVRSLESISDTASVSSVAPVGLMYENATDVNKEYLDLNINIENLQGEDFISGFEEEDDDDGNDDDMEEFEDMC